MVCEVQSLDIVLITTAAGIGIFHTILAIDHYIPFAVMSKANNWSLAKTIRVVLICGTGHVLASVLLGLLGIYLGTHLSFFTEVEELRGEIAKWLLVAFGAVYTLFGIKSALKNAPHTHLFDGKGKAGHSLHDGHDDDHSAVHSEKKETPLSFWPLFVVMVFGPCEFLIPLLMYPAAEYGVLSAAIVAFVFSVCTVATMVVCTVLTLKGITMLPVKNLERYSHALTGFAIFACGIAVHLFNI